MLNKIIVVDTKAVGTSMGQPVPKKKAVEITGLETLEDFRNLRLQKESNKQTTNKVPNSGKSNLKNRKKPQLSVITIESTNTSICTKNAQAINQECIVFSSLPVVSASMKREELEAEMKMRIPTADIDDKTKDWLLDNLKIGTISVAKAVEILGVDKVNQLPKITSSMTVEQLKKEYMHRHPFKKKLTRGKWKEWFLYQLSVGSLCVSKLEENNKCTGNDNKSKAKSPQHSISNTVTTAASTLFSESTTKECDGQRPAAVSLTTAGHDERDMECSTIREQNSQYEKNKTMLALESKKRYLDASRAARKQHVMSGGCTVIQTETEHLKEKSSSSISRRGMGYKQKYLNASKISRQYYQAQSNESLLELYTIKGGTDPKSDGTRRIVDGKPTTLGASGTETIQESKTAKSISARPKISERGSVDWLSSVKQARKASRRSSNEA